MTELYLIAHRVRGEPAFDIATHMDCPECGATGCPECDDLGYWWIIPTSGHRAYPAAHIEFSKLMIAISNSECDFILDYWREIDVSIVPDHYIARATPKVSLIEALGLRKPASPSAPTAPFPRRL